MESGRAIVFPPLPVDLVASVEDMRVALIISLALSITRITSATIRIGYGYP
jgi:hypothetical protein